MNTDERILKALGDLGERLEALDNGQKALQADVKELHRKSDNVELKTEAIHEYQLKAHREIVELIHDTTEINGQEQRALEKRIARIEKHLGLPSMK